MMKVRRRDGMKAAPKDAFAKVEDRLDTAAFGAAVVWPETDPCRSFPCVICG
jgi:hypothetical protein